MCGIIAYIGFKDCFKILLDGLKQLQNRGYDSAGICTIDNSKNLFIKKYASINNKNAIKLLDEIKPKEGTIGIGHTRWATHGPKTDINSHPHMDNNEDFILVHNGIIENYLELKNFLIKNNYTFKSQTDTEIIVNLISYEYNLSGDVVDSINKTIDKLEGTYALCIISKHTPNKLYCVKHGSPLLISCNENFALVSSEQSGFCNKTNKYICLGSKDICTLEKQNDRVIIKTKYKYNNHKISFKDYSLKPDPYKYWTIKEINEQIESSNRAISFGGRLLDNDKVKLGGLNENINILKRIDNLILLGCGTSYFAGMLGMNYFKELCNFNTVQLFDGAEFTENDIPKVGHTVLVLLSQSGETKDLHRCIEIGKNKDLFLIGVVNVVDSMIAREVNCGCYLNAGREVGVASTKSFTSQSIILSMMAVWFSQIHDINQNKRLGYIKDLRQLSEDISKTINMTNDIIEEIIPIFENKNNLFILGKEKSEAIAKEGALKIKEISYIHAEGYSGSSLKHGPFALLEKDFPVILIDPNNKFHSKMENAYEEIKSRYAKIITITDDVNYKRDNMIIIPNNITFRSLLSVIPLQIIAFKLSLKRGYNPDFPRNLAKCVTTE